MQSGIMDLWATDAYMTLERSKNFLYPTPFVIEKYGALMKRQKKTFYIDIDGLTAGIEGDVYVLLLATSLVLFTVSWLNELFKAANGNRNSCWDLLLSQFPSNG